MVADPESEKGGQVDGIKESNPGAQPEALPALAPAENEIESPGVLRPSSDPAAGGALTTGMVAEAPPPISEAERFIARREKFEQEFEGVRQIGFFYAAMLVPLLVIIGWGYHVGGKRQLFSHLRVTPAYLISL